MSASVRTLVMSVASLSLAACHSPAPAATAAKSPAPARASKSSAASAATPAAAAVSASAAKAGSVAQQGGARSEISIPKGTAAAMKKGASGAAAAPAPVRFPQPLQSADMIRADALTAVGKDSLDRFVLDRPEPVGPGQCGPFRLADGTRAIRVSYPDSMHAESAVIVTTDASGKLARYSEKRGGVTLRVKQGVSVQAALTDLKAQRMKTRSSAIEIDFASRRVLVANYAGNKPDQAAIFALSDARAHSRLGAPGLRAEGILARCGARAPRIAASVN